MTTPQWDFLKESDTSLGLFYPLHYIVAGYPDMPAARAAEAAFHANGTSHEDVRAVTGEFVAEQLEAMDEESWLEQAKASLVEFMGTEAGYLREDKRHARARGGFLFVYAPDDTSLARANGIFGQHRPTYARRYLRPAIEIIVRNPDSV